MRKKTLYLCMMVMLVSMTGCKKTEVSQSQVTISTEENAKIQSVGSYKKVYKRISAITLKQKLNDLKGIFSDYDCVLETTTDSAETIADGIADTSTKEFGTTNVVTKGIDEGDIIKNDGEYLYLYETDYSYSENAQIRIVKVDEGDMRTVSTITPYEESVEERYLASEFYVQDDTLILLVNEQEDTSIEFYDISDRNHPKIAQTRTQDGGYVSSRLENGYLYLVTEKMNDLERNIKKEDCIPSVDKCLVEPDCIYMPELGETKNFITCTSFSLEDEFKVKDNVAVLATSNHFYMSEKNIYLHSTALEDDARKTEIMRISYQDGELELEAEGQVEGFLSDTFAMNEYNGYLRLVMMQETNSYINGSGNTVEDTTVNMVVQQDANCLNVLNDKLEVVGEIEDIAPGETIYSARFIGDIGYFVTFKQIDPLFSVDLSDPANPKIIGELKIPGFSEYLHPYSEDLLLGVGVEVKDNASAGLKLSMFDISDPSDVKELDKTVFKKYETSDSLYNYKALCINPEKNIFGFSSEGWGYDTWYKDYNIYSYDKKEGFIRHKVVSYDLDEGYINDIRGTYVDDTFYTVLFGDKIIATDLNTMDEIGTYELDK